MKQHIATSRKQRNFKPRCRRCIIKVTVGLITEESDKDKRLTAYHGDYAVVSKYLPTQDVVRSINHTKRNGGYTMYRNNEDNTHRMKEKRDTG